MATQQLKDSWSTGAESQALIQAYQRMGWSADDAQKMAQAANPYNDMPDAPNHTSLLDPQTGQIQKSLQVDPGAPITADQRGMNEYRNEALRNPGTQSAWAGIQTQRQALSEQKAMGDAATQAASANSNARSSLAQRGGLTAGAGERLATQSQRDTLASDQNIAQQGSNQRLQIGSQDEQSRQQMLSSLPGMEIQNLEPAFRNKAFEINAQQFNDQNSINAHNSDELADWQKYQTQMAAWASNKQSDATVQASKDSSKK